MNCHSRIITAVITHITVVVVVLFACGCSTTHRNVANTVEMSPEWNTNYFMTPTYNAKAVQTATEFATAESFGGAVALRDGSRWEVREDDRREAMVWRPASRVIVVQSSDENWPYTIINLDTHNAEGLKVRPGG